MSVNKIEMNNLVHDLQSISQSGIKYDDALEALKLIELRRLNSNLEYLGSIMEHAPWNLKEE